jgi:Asp-tRNA(Asn)/Glu-tRNA(Gln) amidotransferase C subunit
MTEVTQQIQHLQKLSCIKLSPEQEKKLGGQLTNIIAFLSSLPDVGEQTQDKPSTDQVSLRTIAGVYQDTSDQKLLANVHHKIINNSIVIKSVL